MADFENAVRHSAGALRNMQRSGSSGLKWLLVVGAACSAASLDAQSSVQGAPQAPVQTAASPEQPKIYKPGDGVSVPKLVHHVDPGYTKEARKYKMHGLTVLSIVVDADGKPRDIRVIRSLAEEYTPELRSAAESLDDSAVKAIGKYRFKPSMLNGKPVPVSIKIEVRFTEF